MTNIPEEVQDQMDAICRAVATGEIALLECVHHETGEPAYVLCAVRERDLGDQTAYDVTPITTLDGRDPYEFTVPPAPFESFTEEMH